MVMDAIPDSGNEGFAGGRYARTEEELHKKAVALLEKCKIAARPSGQKAPKIGATTETSPLTVQKDL
jgi:hypothetical protein